VVVVALLILVMVLQLLAPAAQVEVEQDLQVQDHLPAQTEQQTQVVEAVALATMVLLVEEKAETAAPAL
jgi:hypothetical protein